MTSDAFFVSRGLPTPPVAGASTFVQIIGDKGAGKTTQVMRWRSAAPGPYHYVPPAPYRDRWRRPPVEALVYADELDRLPRLLRRRWFASLARRGATLICGTHVDLGAAAFAAGFAEVRTHEFGPVDLEFLHEIVARRMAAAALPGCALTLTLTDDDVCDAQAAGNGSIREAENYLHQLVARRVANRTAAI